MDSVGLVVLDEVDKLVEPVFCLVERFIGSPQFHYKVHHCHLPAWQTFIKQAALLTFLSHVPYTLCDILPRFSNLNLHSTFAQATLDFLNSRGFPAISSLRGRTSPEDLQPCRPFNSSTAGSSAPMTMSAQHLPAQDRKCRKV